MRPVPIPPIDLGRNMTSISISGPNGAPRLVGQGHPCFVIAEAGVNHDGDVELAHRLIDVAADAGADAVKFQTYETDALVSAGAPKARYQIETTGADESQRDMLKRLELPRQAHDALKRHAESRGVVFLSTPFDAGSAAFLRDLGVSAFKLPSQELINLPFLAQIAAYSRPMLVSTGMATIGEVASAMDTIERSGAPPVALFHCVSAYPAEAEDANLRAMATLSAAFGVPVGFSDHTLGTAVALASIALGATVLEKHFTLDRTRPGPDHRASLEGRELAQMIAEVRLVEAALGDGRKRPQAKELGNGLAARKSLIAARNIAAGVPLSPDDIIVQRPGTGLPPAVIDLVIGRALTRSIVAGTPITRDLLA